MLQVIATLMGTGPTPVLDRQLDDFIRRVDADLEDLVWQAAARGLSGATDLAAAVAGLSKEQRSHALLCPDFYAALREARSQMSIGSFINLCAAMEPAADACDRDDEGNAIGASPYARVGEVIRVDLRTQQARRIDLTSPVFFKPFEDPTPSESLAIISKLDRAIREIDDIAPTFGRLIRNYTRRIYVRKVEGEAPASEQVDTEVGSIRLRNVHQDGYTHEQIMDDLIHESVHNFLATFEYLNYPFIIFGGRNDRASARPVSPWSLRPIQMLPFLHAAFVYFAIANFAKLRLGRLSVGSEDREGAVRQYNRYVSGFLVPGRLSRYALGQADVDPRVLGALDWMQEATRQANGLKRWYPKGASEPECREEGNYVHTLHAAA